jgi:hypothetical protein
LRNEKERALFLPLDGFTRNHLKSRGFNIVALEEFAVGNLRDAYGQEFINMIKSADYFYYKNINLIDLVDTEFFIFFLEKFIRQLEASIRLIDTHKPDWLVIWANSHDWASLSGLKFSPILAATIRLVSNSRNVRVADLAFPIVRGKFDLICFVRPYLKFVRELVLSTYSSVKCFLRRKNLERNSKEKIIFLNHSFSLNTILPIMGDVEKNRNVDSLLIQISGLPPKTGFPNFYERWDYFFHIGAFAKMVTAWFSLKNKLKILQRSNFWERMEYKGVKIGGLIRGIFIYFANTRLLSTIKFIEMAKVMLENENVKFIVTPEERILPNRAICAVASQEKIPTLLIQRGLYGNHPIYRFPFLVDKVALEGEWVREALVKMGHNISKFVVTGQPAYDLLKERYGGIDKTAIYSKYGLNIDNTKIVVYTSQALVEGLSRGNNRMPIEIFLNHKEEIRQICQPFCNKEGILLLIKPHPNEDGAIHNQIVRELKAGNIKVLSKNANTYELISISDILITRHSTTGLEAIILDKPVIVVNLMSGADGFPYVEYGSALGVYRKEDIWPAVKSIFEDKLVSDNLRKGRAGFIRDFAHRIDGESSKRIVALMNSMVKESGEDIEN